MASGTFGATGQSDVFVLAPFSPDREVNISLSGTFVATVQPERSFDAGAHWLPMTYIDGSAITWTAPLSTSIGTIHSDMQLRLNCTAYSSGTVTWRID